MNPDPRIGRLLIRWRQLRNEGRTPTAAELCADCPELQDALDQQIQRLTALEAGENQTTATLRAPSDEADREKPTRLSAEPPPTDEDTDDPATLQMPPGAKTGPPTVVSGTVAGPWKPSTGGPPADPAPAALGLSDTHNLLGYRLLERLGGGSFGMVYRALSSGGVEVAVKEIRYSAGHFQAQRELEALELIKGLRHPYLLALHAFWIESDHLYMAMELADGSLAQLAGQRGTKEMSQPEVMRIFEEAAEALDFLHQQHVLHRDVKPANILLLRGHTKVADLGLAKFKPEDVSVSQNVAGTPAYMAPETFRNEFRAESDQYALALCYAELRLGRQLCDGAHFAACIAWHLYLAPNLEGVRPHEQQALRRALSKNPADRFPSCQDFVRALQAPRPAPKARRSGLLAAGAALLAVAALALLLWRFWPHPEKTTAPPILDAQVNWTPEHHGFLTPPGAKIKMDEIGNRRYYDRIHKRVGGSDVPFLLIPRRKPGDPQTFYMMENKATNGLFKTAASDPDFQQLLAAAKRKYPALKWDEWRFGGVRNGNENVGDADDLPVLRVNVMEAYCFAEWIGGKGEASASANLPTEPQWDEAAGKGSGAKEIYRDPDVPLQPGDVAVNRLADGPMPAGAARRDVSPFGCHDMAGDGMEWTRDLESGDSFPPQEFSPDLLATVRGRSYYKPDPFRYSTPPDWRPFKQGDPAVGFRVVVEP